jgi:hypothetical protein
MLVELEELTRMKTVDLTPRKIKSLEVVDFCCHSCNSVGTKQWKEAKKTLKNIGFAYQCQSCLKDKYKNRGDEWLQNVRKAAQSPEHKARAVKNGKTRLLLKDLKNVTDYWSFTEENLQQIPVVAAVTGTCLVCCNVSIKPLKKFLEACSHETHGCMVCWNKVIFSKQHAKTMQARSVAYWLSSDSKEARQQLRDRAKQLREAYEAWATANPDLVGSSESEREILSWVNNILGVKAAKYFNKMEIDVYVKSLKIGIEHNGLFWHSELKKKRNYHTKKNTVFKKQDIRIIHIFAHQWTNRKNQCKSYLRSALGGNSRKIFARKCTLKEIDYTEAKDFLDNWHIQSHTNNIKLALGIFIGSELVSVATFGQHHRQSNKVVLNRFCTKEDVTVVGGLSKMTVHASRHFKVDIFTWADNGLSNGNGYLKAGWEIEEVLSPDYFYTNGKKVFSKQSRSKKKVGTPDGITEHAHALFDGLFRVYDSGKTRFVYRYRS